MTRSAVDADLEMKVFYVNLEDGGVVCVMFMDSFFFQIK